MGITINPMRNELGFRTGLLLLAADITDRKLLQFQLAQAQRMESIGQLAAGIAHEINTPTQYIGDNTRFLQEAFEDLRNLLLRYDDLLKNSATLNSQLSTLNQESDLDYLLDEIPRAIQQSLEGIERVTKIVQAMKEFSHPGSEEKVAVDINRAIESTITVARNEWKYVAEVECDFDSELPLVPCLPGDFNQVILNILVNAAHAIGEMQGESSSEKGLIKVSTRLDSEWAEIRISDTGGGIPEEIAGKVFDPFFTTKEVGKGTGQGLAIVHSIVVEKHQGAIRFETEPGQTTTFIIRLPLNAVAECVAA